MHWSIMNIEFDSEYWKYLEIWSWLWDECGDFWFSWGQPFGRPLQDLWGRALSDRLNLLSLWCLFLPLWEEKAQIWECIFRDHVRLGFMYIYVYLCSFWNSDLFFFLYVFFFFTFPQSSRAGTDPTSKRWGGSALLPGNQGSLASRRWLRVSKVGPRPSSGTQWMRVKSSVESAWIVIDE